VIATLEKIFRKYAKVTRVNSHELWRDYKQQAYLTIKDKTEKAFWNWLEEQPEDFRGFMGEGFRRNQFPPVFITPNKKLYFNVEDLALEFNIPENWLRDYLQTINYSEKFWERILDPTFWFVDPYRIRRLEPSTGKIDSCYRDTFQTRILQEFISTALKDGRISVEQFNLIVKNFTEGFFVLSLYTDETPES
jgi:hypothetical protein